MQRHSLLGLLLLLAGCTTACASPQPACPAASPTGGRADCQPLLQLSGEQQAALQAVTVRLAAAGKGILAADESAGTMGKRLARIGLPNTLANREAWRRALLTAPGLARHLSGVIVTEETLEQPLQPAEDAASQPSDSAGSAAQQPQPRLVDALLASGVLAGLKVDAGLAPLDGGDSACVADGSCETRTLGADAVAERCARAREGGASFTKWRAALVLAPQRGWPSAPAVGAAAAGLAAFAAASQAHGLVPIVEPELLVPAGSDAGLEAAEAAATRVLAAVVHELLRAGVLLEGVLVKPAFVLPASASSEAAGGGEAATAAAAAATLRVLRRTLPPAVGGVAFLSGGQSQAAATALLAAVNTPLGGAPGPTHPWPLTFSFGRALQAAALEAWGGQAAGVAAAQQALIAAAAAAHAAVRGRQPPPAGDAGSSDDGAAAAAA